jgi:hypothetical protein
MPFLFSISIMEAKCFFVGLILVVRSGCFMGPSLSNIVTAEQCVGMGFYDGFEKR